MADYKLTNEQATVLLKKLSSDDDYRKLFQNDLAAAFQQLPGQPAPPEPPKGEPDLEPGSCLRPTKLASKEKIAEASGALLETLTSYVSQKIFMLEE